MLKNLIASEHVDSIYYMDLFRIDGQCWAIAGHGKSEAGRIASGKVLDNDLARDSVALLREGARLYGRYDPGAINPQKMDLHAPHRVDVVAFCLSERDTQEFVDNQLLLPARISNAMAAELICSSPYTGAFAQHFFPPGRVIALHDPARMRQRFIELTEGIEGTVFIAVPWMETAEEKAQLYRSICRVMSLYGALPDVTMMSLPALTSLCDVRSVD